MGQHHGAGKEALKGADATGQRQDWQLQEGAVNLWQDLFST
jgi:hypothetical protein